MLLFRLGGVGSGSGSEEETMADYSFTNYLLPGMKRHALVPLAASTLSETDFLAIVNEEVLALAVALAKQRQEFFVRRVVDQALVAGQDTYPLNTRALCALVRDAVVVQSNGETRNLAYKTPDEAQGTERLSGQPSLVFLEGSGSVVVRPVPADASESLRLSILERPNRIVSNAEIGRCSTKTSTVVTLASSAPGTFTTASPLDIVEGRPPYRTLARDITPTNVAGSAVTFNPGDIPSALVAGDFVCLAEESPVAQLPVELFPALTMAGCANALETLNQGEKAQAKRAQANEKASSVLTLVRPKMKGETRKMRNGMNKWSMGGSEGWAFWRAT